MHCHCHTAFVSTNHSSTNNSSRVRSNLRWCYSRWSPVLSGSLTQAASCTDSLRWSWRFRCGSRTYHSPHATRWHWTEGLDTTLTRASLLRAGCTSCRCCSNSMADIIQGWKCTVHAMLTLERILWFDRENKGLWSNKIMRQVTTCWHLYRKTPKLHYNITKTYLCNQ